MIDITLFIDEYMSKLNKTFGERIYFVGLQGSYSRGEATEASDVDIVVILDEVTASDIKCYDTMLNSMSHRELLCGFISGKREIMNWEAGDLFQLYHDTKPIRGNLDELAVLIDEAAVRKAIKTGVCNIYHGCAHNMLYDKSDDILKGLYKAASFVLQAICFKQTGRYIIKQKDLIAALSSDDRKIAETFMLLKQGGAVDFTVMSDELFTWAGQMLADF